MTAKTIYGKDGTPKAIPDNLEYSGEYMGECFVQVTVKSTYAVNFEVGDYIDYRGERFYLNYVPACKLVNEEFPYQYENMKFDSVSDELVRCTFKDVVIGDNEVHWTGMNTFSFYTDRVNGLAERIQANLDFVYGTGKWNVVVDSSFTQTNEQNISASDNNVLEALTWCYDKFKANFIIRGRTITIGTSGKNLGRTFKFGMGKGLMSLERQADSSQAVITRLRAYGNTTNLPLCYYKYSSVYVRTSINLLYASSTGTLPDSTFELGSKALNDTLNYYKLPEGPTQSTLGLNYTITVRYGSLNAKVYASAFVLYDEKNNVRSLRYVVRDKSFRDWITANPNGTIDVYGGGNIKMGTIIGSYESEVITELYPNNMAVDRLMLPGFPDSEGYRDLGNGYKLVYTKSDVYIDSPNQDVYGIREGTVYIDGTDNDSTDEDVYPSLYKMTATMLRNAGIPCDIPSSDNGHLDQLAATEMPTDKGDPDITGKSSYATLWTKDIGFNPKDYLVDGETAQVYIKTGMCSGQTFDIHDIYEDKSSGYTRYKIEINRKDDSLGYSIPNQVYDVKPGAEFVLLGIRMPDLYIQAASERLLIEAMKYLKDNDKPKFTFTPQLDAIYMEKDYMDRGKESIFWNMKEGDVFSFDESETLGIMGSLFISSISIKEDYVGDNPLPEYTVSLEEKKTVSTLTKMQSQVSSIIGIGNGEGLDQGTINAMLDRKADDYLKRKVDDTAQGQIAIEGGVVAKSSGWDDAVADGLAEWF